MTLPTSIIRIFFGLEYSGGDFFTLNDAVRGQIDNTTYLIASEDGDGVDVQSDNFALTVRRGRSREFDEFEAGTATVLLRNFERTYDPLNAAGVYFGDLVPGKRIEVFVWGVMIFSGTIEDWNLAWPRNGQATATVFAVDALGDLARKDFDAWTATAGQTAGPRITDALNRTEVAFGANRDIGTGVSTLQGDSVTWGSNVLNYCQLVVKSDQGRFYASRENVLTFSDRHDLVGDAVTLTFTDDGTETDFHGITTEVGAELLFNRVGIDREGGTLQTKQDAVSQAAYGVRTLSITGLLMDSDGQSESMAEYLVGIYKDPTARVSSILVKAHGLSAGDAAAVAELEIGDLVRVIWTPLGVGDPVDQIAVVEGVEHSVSLAEHVVVLHLAPSTQSGVFILDDPVWGVLDTGPGVLSF